MVHSAPPRTGRALPLVVLVFAVLAALAGPLVAVAGAQTSDVTPAKAQRRLADLVVDEPPEGFVREPSLDEAETHDGLAVRTTRGFVHTTDSVELELSLWDPSTGTGSVDFTLAALMQSTPDQAFDVAGVHPSARGVRIVVPGDDGTRAVHAAAVPHGGLVVDATHTSPVSAQVPDSVVSERLRTVVEAQLARPSVPAVTSDVPQVAAYMESWLLEDPGTAPGGGTFFLLPRTSGLVTRALYERVGFDGPGLGLLDELDGVARAVLRQRSDPLSGISVVAQVYDMSAPSDAEALVSGFREQSEASGLAVTSSPGAPVLTVAGAARDADAEVVGAAGRRGHTAFLLAAVGPVEREVLLELAGSLADRQLQALPEPELVEDQGVANLLGQASGFLVVWLGLVLVVRLLRLRRARAAARTSAPPVLPASAVSVTEHARRLRRAGRGSGLVMALALIVAPTGLVPVAWPGGLVLSLAALLTLAGAAASRRRLDPRRGPSLPLLRRPRLLRSAVLASVSATAALMALGLLGVAATLALELPSLAARDLERAGGDEPTSMELLPAALSALPAMVAVVTFRMARRQARLRGAEVRRLDPRDPVLFLRGFADDRLSVPTAPSGRRPLLEQLAVRDRFEVVVTRELDGAGPPVAIAPPGAQLASLGAAREHAPDPAEWFEYVCSQIELASVVVVALGGSDGVVAELEAVQKSRARNRSLLLFPPVGDDELRQRWRAARERIREGAVMDLGLDPAAVLVAVGDGDRMVAYTADLRDEAGYRAAVRAALERLQSGQGARPRVDPDRNTPVGGTTGVPSARTPQADAQDGAAGPAPDGRGGRSRQALGAEDTR